MALPQPIIWHTGDVNSDLLQITGGLRQGHASSKKQNVITWLQIFMLHFWRPKAPLQTQLSFEKCCMFNKLMWSKTVEISLASSSVAPCEV